MGNGGEAQLAQPIPTARSNTPPVRRRDSFILLSPSLTIACASDRTPVDVVLGRVAPARLAHALSRPSADQSPKSRTHGTLSRQYRPSPPCAFMGRGNVPSRPTRACACRQFAAFHTFES
jgi:hypothetical protein